MCLLMPLAGACLTLFFALTALLCFSGCFVVACATLAAGCELLPETDAGPDTTVSTTLVEV